MNDVPDERERVRGRIADAVIAFVREHPGQFHMSGLLAFVASRMGRFVAPDSPSRILRALAADGVVAYRVVSRRHSLYTAIVLPQQRSLAL